MGGGWSYRNLFCSFCQIGAQYTFMPPSLPLSLPPLKSPSLLLLKSLYYLIPSSGPTTTKPSSKHRSQAFTSLSSAIPHSDSLSRDHSPLLTYAFILTGSLTQRERSHPNVITCIHHFTPPSIDCSNSQVIKNVVTCVSSQSQKHKGGGEGGHSNRSCTCTRNRSQKLWSSGQNWSKGRLQVGVASFTLK